MMLVAPLTGYADDPLYGEYALASEHVLVHAFEVQVPVEQR